MKIKDRLEKLIDDGIVTAKAVDEAQKKGWITAKQRTSMNKKVDDALLRDAVNVLEAAERKGLVMQSVVDGVKGKTSKG